MKSELALTALRSLAQETRLTIYRLLVRRGPQGFTPGELVERLEMPGPTLSFHLRELQRAGLIGARREGRFLHYGVNLRRMNELLGYLTEQCCSLADGDTSGCQLPQAVAIDSIAKRKRA